MYGQIMQVEDTYEVPTTQNETVITKKVSHIKAVWKSKYGITKPALKLEFEIMKTRQGCHSTRN
jgi:hypothetical protein